MKAIIIDDELDAIKSLSILLNEYCKEVKVVGIAHSALEGIKLITKTSPDLVFLDVEMPNGMGFDLLESIPHRNFHLIFITAYEHYAIQAIRTNAIDYLLKPIDIDELISAVDKAKELMLITDTEKDNDSVSSPQKDRLTKIPISLKNEYLLVDLKDIHFIKSDGSYSIIYTLSKNYTTAKNLKYYESLLSGSGFLRVSNSHLINIDKVEKYVREDGGVVKLHNQAKIAVAKSKKEILKQKLGI